MGSHNAAPVGLTERRKRTEHYAKEWENHCDERTKQWKKDGRPILRKPKPPRGPEIVLALELFLGATGDQAFAIALAAMEKYGFDREAQTKIDQKLRERFGHPLDDYLVQVEFLIERSKVCSKLVGPNGERRKQLSVREACEIVTAEYGIPGHSFQAVVEELRKRYRRAEHPIPGARVPQF